MKHTKGKWKLKKGGNFSGTFVNYINCGHINIAQTRGGDDEMTEEENLANAKLFVEAGNVANETGCTPKQLAEQKAELLEALQNIVNCSCSGYGVGYKDFEKFVDDLHPFINKAKQAIKNATS